MAIKAQVTGRKTESETEQIIKFLNQKQPGGLLGASSACNGRAIMILKCINVLLWKEGCAVYSNVRKFTISTIEQILDLLQPEFECMVTSIMVASNGPEMARIRLIHPAMDTIYHRCLEYTKLFQNDLIYLERLNVPSILYQLTLFTRVKQDPQDPTNVVVDEDADPLSDLSDPADKICLMNQMFYEFLDMLEKYVEFYEEVSELYRRAMTGNSGDS